MPVEISRLHRDSDWAGLQAEWRNLEARSDGSFFQSWTWVGCRVRERFADPLLVRARMESGEVGGLALFNRVGPSLRRLVPAVALHETGRPDEDSVFIEHNAPLIERGQSDLLRPMLAAALRHGRLILSGVDDAVRAIAASVGHCRLHVSRPAPFVRLRPGEGSAWLARLGASTRYSLRRSLRSYEAAGRHQTPGLTCHHLAIEEAARSGYEIYDFLAGAARYKSNLGHETTQLHWLEVSAGMPQIPWRGPRRPAAPVTRQVALRA